MESRHILLYYLLMVASVNAYGLHTEPRITNDPSCPSVLAGSRSMFYCQSEGEPLPEVWWTVQKRPVLYSHGNYTVTRSPGGTVLIIDPVQWTGGSTQIMCSADNGHKYVEKFACAMQLYKTAPKGFPTIVQQPKPQTIRSGEYVKMTVGWTGDNSTGIQYIFKDNMPVNITDCKTTNTKSGGQVEFVINGVKKADEGEYRFMVVNDLGAAYSNAVILHVVDEEKPRITSFPNNTVYVKPGGSTSLTCHAEGAPLPEVTWVQDERQLTKGMGESVLKLTNIQQSTDYSCIASSPQGYTWESVTVVIQASTIRIVVPAVNERVQEGSDVYFICRAEGEIHTITWMVDGQYQDGIPIITDNNYAVARLEAVSYKTDNNREMTCVAEDQRGTQATSKAILEVYPPGQVPGCYPYITVQPRDRRVLLSTYQKIAFNCQAMGDPEPTYSWLKDFIPVNRSESRIQATPAYELEIENVELADQGVYTCVARNSVGVTYSEGASLLVVEDQSPPEFVTVPDTPQVISAGSDLSLTCTANGYPVPYIVWSVGIVNLTDPFNVPQWSNTLELKDIKTSADYTCLAYSVMGKIKAVTEIRVMTSG